MRGPQNVAGIKVIFTDRNISREHSYRQTKEKNLNQVKQNQIGSKQKKDFKKNLPVILIRKDV